MNPIRVGFFSLTGGIDGASEAEYLRWHLLDHQPEQYSIPGVRLATRWHADEECVAGRVVESEALAPVRHCMSYLMTEPVDETLRSFAELGRRTAESGRFGARATTHLLGGFHLLNGYSSPRVLVSAEAVPFRAHRGVILLIENVTTVDASTWVRWHHQVHVPELLAADGVAGVYQYRSSTLLGVGVDQGLRYSMPMWDPGDRFVTTVFVDLDLCSTSAGIAELLQQRWATGEVSPELAGPFRSMTTHRAWPDS